MNKMFKKLMAVSATVAIAATMSVSAFAADVTVAPTDKAVTVTPTEVKDATMYTVMVFSTTADITDAEKLAAATPANGDAIYYINQGADVEALVTNMLVKATTVDETTSYLPVGNYVVRIGNDKGSVQNFGLVSEEEALVLYGDVDGDGNIKLEDAIMTLKAALSAITLGDDAKFAADVDGDKNVKLEDAILILKRSLGAISKFPIEG
jgi:hypothetical protein